MPGEGIHIPPGTVLAGFRIESELGIGNNGEVYLARQMSLDRCVALKILLPELAEDRSYRQSFLHEARLAARLDHPNIVQAYDAGVSPEGYYYFAMELVNGCSVEDIRRQHPEQLTFAFLFTMARQLAEALDYAWNAHKVTHGDIKPGNLLITGNGELKLADLGLARIHGGQEDEEIMATPLYAPPEIIRGEKADGVRADLYSFGVMMYELLCGAPPWMGSPEWVLEQHLTAAPEPLLDRNPDLDPRLAAFVERLMSKTPADRPASWEEVRDFFARMEPQRTLPAKGVSAPPERNQPLAHPSRKRLWVVLLLLLALAAAGTAGYFAYQRWAARRMNLVSSPVESVMIEHRVFAAPPPELSVALSSPSAFEFQPEIAPVSVAALEEEAPPPPPQLPVAEPPAVPNPADTQPTPEPEPEPHRNTLPEIRRSDPPPTAPTRRPTLRRRANYRSLGFDPDINEAELKRQIDESNRMIARLSSTFSDEWKAEAALVVEETYRLLAQLGTRQLNAKKIDRIDILSSGRGAGWNSTGPLTGTLRLAPVMPPTSIAGALGKGFFEANQSRYKLPSHLKDQFAEAIQYFVEQRLNRSPGFPANRVLRQCDYDLPEFVHLFQNKHALETLRKK